MNNQANPYSAPDSTLIDPPRPPASALKAILAGLAIDIGGSYLVNTILSICYGVYLGASGESSAQIVAKMTNLSPFEGISLVCMVTGSFMSIAGGFVCTRMAKRSDYQLGFIMASISAILGLLLSFTRFSIMINVAMTLLTFACVMAGAHFGRVRAADK